MGTIFAKILRGELPCHKVYEDEHVLAFLDIGPLSYGHVLVIPKEPAVTLGELSPESGAAIGRALPRLCRAVQRVTGCAGYNVLQNNGVAAHQAVMHVHFHIIPKPSAGNVNGGDGLEFMWKPGRLDNTEGRDLAELLRTAVAEGQ